MPPLKDKRRERLANIYVDESFKDGHNRLSMAEIARKAGYDCNSDAAFHRTAQRALDSPAVKARVKEIRTYRLHRLKLTEFDVQKLITTQLVNIISSDITDIVNIITEKDKDKRAEQLQELEEAYGGVVDLGLGVFSSTLNLSDATKAAIKQIKAIFDKDGNVRGVEVSMYDKIQAIERLAELSGLKQNNIVVNNVSADIENDPEAISKAMSLVQQMKAEKEAQRIASKAAKEVAKGIMQELPEMIVDTTLVEKDRAEG